MSLLLFRVEASPRIGLGHVMRTLAVAERAVAARREVRYVVPPGPAVALVRERGMAATVVPEDTDADPIPGVGPGDAVVFDGYGFTVADERRARARGAVVAAIDDRSAGDHDVDVLLDANPHLRTSYRVPADARLLLGPRHALVRNEFLALRRPREGPPGTLLLTFGGSDPTGLLDWALAALTDDAPFNRVLAVVGPAARSPAVPLPAGTQVVRGTGRPATLFDHADAAVAAAGSTTWELLAMGVPVAVIAAVDNQIPVRDGVARLGVGLAVHRERGPAALRTAVDRLSDGDLRAALSAAGRRLVTGEGPHLLLQALDAASAARG